MIHLKTNAPFASGEQRFAVLLAPASTGITDDETLHSAVRGRGFARIHRFKADNPLVLEDAPVEIPAADFVREWIGD